jgi:hypothetical protein
LSRSPRRRPGLPSVGVIERPNLRITKHPGDLLDRHPVMCQVTRGQTPPHPLQDFSERLASCRLATTRRRTPQVAGCGFSSQGYSLAKLRSLPLQAAAFECPKNQSNVADAGVSGGRVSRASLGVPALRNCTRDEGGPFGFGDQEPISSHRKLLWSKAMVVSVAESRDKILAGMVERGERKRTAAEVSKAD